MFAVFHAVRGVPERRNVVRSYPGFSDATKLIVGARLGLERVGVEQEVGPPVVSAIAAADSRAWLRIVSLHRCPV